MSTTVVRERPILFRGDMVRAILAGRKTQTRRIIKPQPFKAGDEWSSKTVTQAWNAGFVSVPCPYGQPGDRLWVRETFWKDGNEPKLGCVVRYKADGRCEPLTWRPSIFMPRWASRLTLEVVAVRVERLQEISVADYYAEGLCLGPCDGMMSEGEQLHFAHEQFALGWDSLNARRGFPWDANPWVWVIEFKRTEAA